MKLRELVSWLWWVGGMILPGKSKVEVGTVVYERYEVHVHAFVDAE